MNWDAVAAGAEILAAIGVIVTLVHVALQVRHNTRAVRAATAREAVAAIRQLNTPMIEDPELARIFRLGGVLHPPFCFSPSLTAL